MAIIEYKNGIRKDTHVYRNNVYIGGIGRGQGCGTIWFRTVKGANKALSKDAIKEGRDLFDCTKCRCHYSIFDKEGEVYPWHACSDLKEEYAKGFEEAIK